MSKQVRTKAAPEGHHTSKEDRQRGAVIKANAVRDSGWGHLGIRSKGIPCNCGNHGKVN